MPEQVYETDVRPEGFWEEQNIKSRFGKLAFFIALIGTLVCFVISTFETFKATHGPLTPDLKHGLIVPFNNHGVIHYISHLHSAWLNTTFALYFPFFIALLVIAARAKLRTKKS